MEAVLAPSLEATGEAREAVLAPSRMSGLVLLASPPSVRLTFMSIC